MSRKIKILSIDDSEDILFAISAICEYQNWEAITAKEAQGGIKLFKNTRPDLVLVDYHMPSMDGIQVVRYLREINSKVPIIVLTVEEKQEIADEFIKAGADDFALKPIKAVDLISRIKVHLKKTITEDDLKKGMTKDTLEIIVKYLIKIEFYVTMDSISKDTGLSYKTVHRYLQHLIDVGRVDVKYDYGKQGRPKNSYKIK